MKYALILLLLCGLAAAQTYEVADIHKAGPHTDDNIGILPNGELQVTGFTMLALVRYAWGVHPDRIVGGPAWVDSDRINIRAVSSHKPTPAEARIMLQNLLTERFGLEVKQEDKPLPVFVLVPGKGTAKEPNGSGDSGCQSGRDGGIVLTCRNTTIEALADMLPNTAPGYFNHPVLDRSGLKGAYNFKLTWAGRASLIPGAEGAGSLYAEIEKQLGLKVEQQTAPQPVVTIVKVNREPTDNPPGTLEKLGPLPTEFDVADIHLSAPGTGGNFSMNNGRIQAKGATLQNLIEFAYGVEDDGIKGGEKWLDEDRYDLVAKSAPTASYETLQVMLRSFLAQRFGLKVHNDVQPLNVYVLTAGKPKLKASDPNSRTTCMQSAVDGARTFTCTNVTMEEFADRVRPTGAAFLDHPVVDMTGLTGSYDLAISFSPRRPSSQPKPAEAVAEAPSGLTLFEAVDRQLGLKLVPQKHPMPVIVIDHLDRKPTEN